MRASTPNGLRRWFAIALLNLAIAATIGCVLRSIYIVEIPHVNFKPLLHAHSHVAMFGWLFIALMVFLLEDVDDRGSRRAHRVLFILVQFAVVGMLVSFPVQSYGPASITFTTLHLLLSYALAVMAWRGTRHWLAAGSRRLVRIAVWMMVISTIGVWAMAPLLAFGLFGSELYYWSIQFFLHFQFNGWFWFAAMALGARWAERQGFALRIDRLTMGLWIVSAVLTYALAIAWSEPLPAVFATVAVAVALQVWAAWRTFGILRRMHNVAYDRIPQAARILIGVALVSMAMKVLVQASVAIPSVAIMALTIRHFVMGFVHMNTLGVMTMLLCSYAILSGWFDLKRGAIRWGLGLLVAGIITSELLLFVQGGFFWIGLGMIPGHYVHLFAASFLMPMGVVLLLIGSLKK